MSLTLDPEVAEALAPFAAETTGSTPPAGRGRRRRAGYRFQCRGPIDVTGEGVMVTWFLLGRHA